MKFLNSIRIPLPFPEIRFWERFNPVTGASQDSLMLTVQQIPTTLTQQRPREASPTGKSGIGIATFSQAPQPIFLARRKTVFSNQPNKRSGHLINTGYIDPYDSIKGQPSNRLNMKWTG